jgi:hypothetical protein
MSKHEDPKPSIVETLTPPPGPAPGGPVTLTHEQLQLLITSAVTSALTLANNQPTREENVKAILDRNRPKGIHNGRILLVSRGPSGTGASFVATYQQTRKGRRIVTVAEYWKPADHIERAKKIGVYKLVNGNPSPRYKQWMYETYRLADMRMFGSVMLDKLLPMYAMTEEEMHACVDTEQPDKPRLRTADPTYQTQVLESYDVEAHPVVVDE